jgi:hypothetical protein
MRTKKQQMMRLTSLAVAARMKDVLMSDFSESLSSQIIKHNYNKHGSKATGFSNRSKTKIVNSIVSDYRAIKPIGSVSDDQLKKSLRLAIE